MNYISNRVFSIAVIPECKATSVLTYAEEHNFFINEQLTATLYAPYRNSHDRIIRGIAADLHELLLNDNVVNLNLSSWPDVKPIVLEYINAWIPTASLPINKQFCHTAYYINYATQSATFVSVDNFGKFHEFLSDTHGVKCDPFPDLSPDFYTHTIPYWELESIYESNMQFANLVDAYCDRDMEFFTPTLLAI